MLYIRASVLIVLSGLSISCFSQFLSLTPYQKAEKDFRNFSYSSAILHYEEALHDATDSANIITKLGVSNLKLKRFTEAKKWFDLLLNTTKLPDTEHIYDYAGLLSSNGYYDESIKWYRIYQEESDDKEPLVTSKIAFLEKQLSGVDSGNYEIKRAEFSSNGADFSPYLFKGDIYFASSRTKSDWINYDYNWNSEGFLNLFKAQKNTKNSYTVTPINTLNGKFHEGSASIFNDGKSIAFTRNNTSANSLKKDEEGISHLQIYFADLIGEGFQNIRPYEYNMQNFSLGHPAMNSTSDVMIFSSDMPGGFGGVDLYVSFKKDNSWSKPKNLGDKVNTEDDDLFPVFINDNLLVYASAGKPGFGGLDLFKTKLEEYVPKEVANLGAPINSVKDDFGLTSADNLQSGYFSSNRKKEIDDDIYHFTYSRPAKVTAKGVVATSDGKALKGALIENTGIETDQNGEYVIQLKWDEEKQLSAVYPEYVTVDSILYKGDAQLEEITLDTIFMDLKKSSLKFVIKSKKDSSLISDAYLKIVNTSNGRSLDNTGSAYTFNVIPGSNYEVLASSEGFYAERMKLTGPEEDKVVEISLKPIVIGESIRLENIYYDLGSANLRSDSEEELEKVVSLMVDNPEIKMELSSHTDARGSAKSNQLLSQKRAESAASYLISQGIDPERIKPKGYGETKIINRCTDGVKCSEAEHQKNRRTEIKILE